MLKASLSADDARHLNWKWMYRISSNWRNGGHYRRLSSFGCLIHAKKVAVP